MNNEEHLDLFSSIIKDTDKVINAEYTTNFTKEFKDTIENKSKIFHEALNKCEEELIKTVLDSYNNEKNQEEEQTKKEKEKDTTPIDTSTKGGKKMLSTSKKQEQIEKIRLEKKQKLKQEKINQQKKEGNYLPKTASEIKIEKFIDNIDNILQQFSGLDNLTNLLKTSDIENIIRINKEGDFMVKNLRKYGFFNKNCKIFPLEWNVTGSDQSPKIKRDESDPELATIDNNTCYSWYRTDQWLEGEDISVEFELKLTTNSTLFYIGVQNENVKYSSNCMCCNIKDATYLKPNGGVCHNSSKVVNNNNLKFSDKIMTETKMINMKIFTSAKEVYFSIGDNDDEGPYTLTGNKFRVVAGSCNSCKGTIRINNAYYI